jgi:hypothetical protein
MVGLVVVVVVVVPSVAVVVVRLIKSSCRSGRGLWVGDRGDEGREFEREVVGEVDRKIVQIRGRKQRSEYI